MLSKIIILSFFSLSTILYGQVDISNGVVTYRRKVTISNEKINADSKLSSSIKKSLISVKSVVDEYSFKLEFNGKLSKYYQSDMMSKEFNDDMSRKLANAIYGFNGTYYYDSSKLKSFHNLKEFGSEWIIINDESKSNWTLTKNKKDIGGYTCYMAEKTIEINSRRGVKKSNIVAWYCPEINLHFGPAEYCNLPGLIFQIDEENSSIYMVEIKFKDADKIKVPDSGKKITKDEFEEYVKEKSSEIRG